ncbi:NAD(P)-binding domain-containing protein [Haliscomenobacter sp.]|uniref:NAD(P)-binding domain-containing protein n=1 Tax=Haliscomenobacter sp. TaxID=2717303 RepID=UPI003593C61E
MVLEQLLIYGAVTLFCLGVLWIYLKKLKKTSKEVEAKIEQAKQDGLFEPISLHPVIDLGTCIQSGACVLACPEKDILGIVNGRAALINASQCIGHGACFHACPVEAISLVIGTEKRGVDLPHVNQDFETNVPGMYIAGELGGMGLIKNSVEQGEAAVESIVKSGLSKKNAGYDLVIVGAGPAGISASLTAKKHGLNFLTLEQESLGGTVYNFPRSKVVMTAPMDIPLFKKVKLFETSKKELLDLWQEALAKNGIQIREQAKVDQITSAADGFTVALASGEKIQAQRVLLAIGRRGTPRKLGIPGEELEKVAYKVLEPEMISNKRIVVVGGGDSAIEAALALAEQNNVILSYRGEAFSRLKPKNRENLERGRNLKQLEVMLQSNLVRITEAQVEFKHSNGKPSENIENDLVFIFAGGELPTDFLKKAGIEITTRFGYTVRKHKH